MPSQHHQTLPRSMWVLLALLTLGWGFNWPMMKLTLADMPVWTFRAICVATGAAGLFLIARLGGQSLRVPRGQWTRLIVTSACNVTLWNVFISYGLTMLPAGRSAILAYSMPIWAVLLSVFILHERLMRRRLLGLVLGMAGMALLIGGLPIMIGVLFIDWGHWRPIGTPAVIGLVYNMFFVFIFCYWAWFKIATTAPPSVSSLSTLMIPIVGVFSGIWLLGESPQWQEYAALVLVIAALATVLIPPRRTAPA